MRDGAALTSVVPFTARVFRRAVVMPNLKPPVRPAADAVNVMQARERIFKHAAENGLP